MTDIWFKMNDGEDDRPRASEKKYTEYLGGVGVNQDLVQKDVISQHTILWLLLAIETWRGSNIACWRWADCCYQQIPEDKIFHKCRKWTQGEIIASV